MNCQLLHIRRLVFSLSLFYLPISFSASSKQKCDIKISQTVWLLLLLQANMPNTCSASTPYSTPTPPTLFFLHEKTHHFFPLVHYFASICNLLYNQSCKDCYFLFALFISSLAFFCVIKHFSLTLIYLNVFLLTFLVINN